MAVVQTLIGNVKGPQGDTGATGATGAQGEAATIEVGSVTTAAYGTAASVTNSGTTSEAVFDFVIPQGAPGETVTDMQNLTLGAMTTSTASFPVPAIGETGKVIFGKIVKWFSDMAALVATKFDASNVVNNVTTTSSGYALDARQGKVLYDMIPKRTNNGAMMIEARTITVTRASDGTFTITPVNTFSGVLSCQVGVISSTATISTVKVANVNANCTIDCVAVYDNGSGPSVNSGNLPISYIIIGY